MITGLIANAGTWLATSAGLEGLEPANLNRKLQMLPGHDMCHREVFSTAATASFLQLGKRA